MSSFADAMVMATLLGNNNTFENRRSSRTSNPFKEYAQFQDWMERKAETREKKEKEKKGKDGGGPKIGYLEAVFWLFFLSPIIGPIWYNLEQSLIRSIH